MTPRPSKSESRENQLLAELIWEAFKASPLNRAALAEASGVPDGSLAKILSGRGVVYVPQMLAIARALDADPVEWLRKVEDAMAGPDCVVKHFPGSGKTGAVSAAASILSDLYDEPSAAEPKRRDVEGDEEPELP